MKQSLALVFFLIGFSSAIWSQDATIEVPENIRDAVADNDRPEGDRARDPNRKPGQVLAFFGVQPGDRVADLMTGTGYYTAILCRAVGSQGKVYSHNSPFVVNRFHQRLGPDGIWSKKLASPAWKNAAKLVRVLEEPGLPKGGLDLVMMALFYHDTYWQEVDRPRMNRAIFEALKPGGVFGIIDHHAASGSGDRDVKTLHRVDVELVKKELIQAGFVLDGETQILRHPEDGHDYNVFRDFQTNRDHTDRFVLRFRKPSQ